LAAVSPHFGRAGVFIAALFLYVFGPLFGAGIRYSLALLLLFWFALARAIALALLIYELFPRWCELRGAPPRTKARASTQV
jgi:hypothetical protein